jgi:hypothetical protein
MIENLSFRTIFIIILLALLISCEGQPQVSNSNRATNSGPTASPTSSATNTSIVNVNGTANFPNNDNRKILTPRPTVKATQRISPTPTPVEEPVTEKMEEGQFSFPPPLPTTYAIKSNLGEISVNRFFGELEKQLDNEKAQFTGDRRSFFSHNGNFALVTRMERTDFEGNKLDDNLRWDRSVPFGCRISQYLNCLFKGKRSYYRVIAFVLTNDSIVFSPPPSFEIAEKWITKGKSDAPETFLKEDQTETILDKKYRCVAMFYIFEYHTGSGKMTFLEQFPTSAKDQLEKLGIAF